VTLALGYMRDTVTEERLEFQFNPEDLPVKVSANYATHTPRGSSHARRQHTHTSGRGGKFNLIFIRRTVDASDVEAMRRRIESLPFGDYDQSGRVRRGPHPMLLVFGAMRTLRVLVMEVEIAQGPHFLADTTAPCELRVSIAWEDAPEQGDLSRDDVLGGL